MKRSKPSDQFLLFTDEFVVGDRITATWDNKYTGQVIAISKRYGLILTVKWDFGAITKLLATSVKK